MLRFGPETGPVVVVALPLFEEANRMRAFAVTICRALAKRDVASVLPDLPGQGESPTPTQDISVSALRAAFAAVVEHLYADRRRCYSATIRSGAISASEASSLGHWQLSPVAGTRLIDDFVKILSASKREADTLLVRNAFQIDEATPPFKIAGNVISPALLQELTLDKVTYRGDRLGVPYRLVRLDTDPGPADRHIPGTPLWRRAEPGNDPALAALLANDIADWIASCES